MSITEKNNALLNAELKNLQKAQERFNLNSSILNAVPSNSPEPSTIFDSAYCGDATMTFKSGDAVQLVELFPPLPLVDVEGGDRSQKPEHYVRDHERQWSSIRPIYPVLFKSSGSEASRATWWTKLAGKDVVIAVDGTRVTEFEDLLEKRYRVDCHSYSTGSCVFYPRALAPVAATRPVQERNGSIAEDEFQEVKAWLTYFFANRGVISERNYGVVAIITQMLRKNLGLDIGISWVRNYRYPARVDVRVTLGTNRDLFRDWVFPIKEDAPGIQPQHLAAVYL